MVVNYKERGVFDVHCERAGMSFQVLTYGLPDPGDTALRVRLAQRGFDKVRGDLDGRLCTERYDEDFKKGRRPGYIGEEKPAQHFFTPRLHDGEAVQGCADKGVVRAHVRDGGAEGGEGGEAEGGRASGDDSGEWE